MLDHWFHLYLNFVLTSFKETNQANQRIDYWLKFSVEKVRFVNNYICCFCFAEFSDSGIDCLVLISVNLCRGLVTLQYVLEIIQKFLFSKLPITEEFLFISNQSCRHFLILYLTNHVVSRVTKFTWATALICSAASCYLIVFDMGLALYWISIFMSTHAITGVTTDICMFQERPRYWLYAYNKGDFKSLVN